MTSELLAHADVASNIELLSTWIEAQMAYNGQPALSIGIVVAEHTFRIEAKDGFSANGELVVFEMDGAGRVQRVKMGENYTYPLAEW